MPLFYIGKDIGYLTTNIFRVVFLIWKFYAALAFYNPLFVVYLNKRNNAGYGQTYCFQLKLATICK